jgi:hypothetical protein
LCLKQRVQFLIFLTQAAKLIGLTSERPNLAAEFE